MTAEELMNAISLGLNGGIKKDTPIVMQASSDLYIDIHRFRIEEGAVVLIPYEVDIHK